MVSLYSVNIGSSGEGPGALEFSVSRPQHPALVLLPTLNKYFSYQQALIVNSQTSQWSFLTLLMLMLLSSKAQGCKDFWKLCKTYHVGIHWIALAEFSQMSTHVPGFRSFYRFFASFCIGKSATSSISVKSEGTKGRTDTSCYKQNLIVSFLHCWLCASFQGLRKYTAYSDSFSWNLVDWDESGPHFLLRSGQMYVTQLVPSFTFCLVVLFYRSLRRPLSLSLSLIGTPEMAMILRNNPNSTTL